MLAITDKQKEPVKESHSIAESGDRKISLLVVEDDENISTAINPYNQMPNL